ncbi:tetratricopeptide repeat protein [Streptomyces sp. NPDC090306]|uniref:tetratricopeptide repeat protein n=1 Tax=Streptomyces sp. NPDC090306 TaxID=3365961 RepID=UPI0037F5D4E3
MRVRVGHPRFGELADGQAQVCWPDPRLGVPPQDAVDVALLWLEKPVAVPGGPVRWGRPSGVAPVAFEGAGFPAFADEEGSGEFEYLRGVLPVVSTASSTWVLDCPVWPAPGEKSVRPWAGASGAAVFCHGRLVGVAVEDNRNLDGRRLHAVPIHEALSPGFADLVTQHGDPGTTTRLEEVTAADRAVPSDEGEVTWPVEAGPVPALASAFQPRGAVRKEIDAAWQDGGTVVLTQKMTQVLSGGGGVGKTQMAAAYAAEALRGGADVVVWAPAAETQQVITQYAQAAGLLALPGATGEDPEADARLLLRWLAHTRCRWLVVLDDINDPAGVEPWWPVSRTDLGRVLATTRLRDARLTGKGRTRIDVDVYTPAESASYLHERLGGEDMDHLLDDRTTDLGQALGHLPLALGLAAAHMINEELTSTEYLGLLARRTTRLKDALPETADTEGYGREIGAALLLSLDAVQTADKTGLATTVLQLTALLDPAGHPHALWAAPPLLTHLTNNRPPAAEDEPTTGPPLTADQAHTVLRLLHRYALLTCDTRAEPRAVRIHALTARAVRENTPPTDLRALATSAADALLHLWPDVDQPHPELAASLRANTDALAGNTADHLWNPDGHVLLYRAGESLNDGGLYTSAIAYWRHISRKAESILGLEHPDTLTARANLANSYREAGRTGEAITIDERVLTDRERILGPEHPHTLNARANLASSYWQAGRTGEAITIDERVLTDRERILGPEHPRTLTARANLANSYRQAGRTREAITIEERVLTDSERLLGPEHPNTLTARANLAFSYWQAGRTGEAITIEERVLTDRERLLGPEHPNTLTTRANLAASYWQAGRTGEAITIEERVLTDRERLLGPEHPDTLNARANLAASYRQTGRTGEAITMQERVLTDSERLLGPEHPDTLTARANLAASYRQTGRTGEAITMQERVLTDRERLLGPEHPDTLNARANLAASYRQAGRTGEAITLQERVLTDSERILGPEHPNTLNARANLAASYRQTGRTGEAITIEERVLTDSERLLGPEHPDTLNARANLAASYRQTGRTGEAITMQERVLTDSERLLGPEHPDTLNARANLAASYRQTGRTGEAITLQERVLTDRERLLGPEHPDTLNARANLSSMRKGPPARG